ncbi:hypothetical protein RF11_15428 [Thelohanellus kitauei]|uniref:Uncharacterized protein n=1 Tax=Thelohanellus kitauei TaxID=669202 RepID=A0A0C2MRQ3_THEKT|nr:hypothetical protein RF11_15428 [Thelohanellus kitauei]
MNPFAKFDEFEKHISLAEDEELASVASDIKLMLKHSEIVMDAFRNSIEHQYLAITEYALLHRFQISTAYVLNTDFRILKNMKYKMRMRVLSLKEEPLCDWPKHLLKFYLNK